MGASSDPTLQQAFGMNWLIAAARCFDLDDWAGLMIHLATFWHGFLCAAMVPGANHDHSLHWSRPSDQATAVVLGIIAAAIVGRHTATWAIR